MKKNKNKKGFTLVEVIVAVAVFGIITTGFITAARYCYTAQTHANRDLKETNQQATNLEHFSNYNTVIDPGEYNLEFMESGTNKWTISYPFATKTVKNDKVYGYISQTTDETFQMGYFSPIERVNLESGEYWINIYNIGSAQVNWYLQASSGFQFFNNQKDVTVPPTSTGQRIWEPGAVRKIGVKNSGTGDVVAAFDIVDYNSGSVIQTIDLTRYADSEGYCNIYYNGSFLTEDEVDALS